MITSQIADLLRSEKAKSKAKSGKPKGGLFAFFCGLQRRGMHFQCIKNNKSVNTLVVVGPKKKPNTETKPWGKKPQMQSSGELFVWQLFS